ncbi:MAG: hypothetical protein AB8G23_20580 [Myxococcota bacterium]
MDYSILDDGQTLRFSEAEISLSSAGDFRVSQAAFEEKLGWELKPQGLCQGEVCVPVRDREALLHEGAIDLGAFASVMGRPYVVDAAEGVAAMGMAADSQASRMASLEAPDFELPDLSGKTHRLSAYRGNKVLFIAYASW